MAVIRNAERLCGGHSMGSLIAIKKISSLDGRPIPNEIFNSINKRYGNFKKVKWKFKALVSKCENKTCKSNVISNHNTQQLATPIDTQ